MSLIRSGKEMHIAEMMRNLNYNCAALGLIISDWVKNERVDGISGVRFCSQKQLSLFSQLTSSMRQIVTLKVGSTVMKVQIMPWHWMAT